MDSSPRLPHSPPTTTDADSTNLQLFKVFLRLRPSSPESSVSETRFITTAPGQSCIYVTPPAERNRYKATEKFAFTRIFEEMCEQREVFEESVLPLLEDAVIRGRDGTLATLGVTGSGKTHTILGSKDVKGMTQMALEVLFNTFGDRVVDFNKVDLQTLDNSEAIVLDTPTFHEKMQSSLDSHFSKRSSFTNFTTPKPPCVADLKIPLPDFKSRYGILLSMYELYNDRVFDLLIDPTLTSSTSSTSRRKALTFKKPSTVSTWDTTTSKEQKKVVSGLQKVYAASFAEALQIIEHGQSTRTVSTTNGNTVSSRSHAFLQIEIKRFSPRHTERGCASLCIVDLAGSERARNIEVAGGRLAEAGSINRSLMCLGQCLQLQTQVTDNGKSNIVPWRQSKLTELLFSNSFSGAGGGQGACMIVTADAMGDFNATSQILRYSAIAREVTAQRTSSRSLSISSSTSSNSDATIDDLTSNVSSLAIATEITIPPRNSISHEETKDTIIARLISQLHEAESRSISISNEESKDTIIARLISQLHEAESRIQLAEERCQAAEERCQVAEERCQAAEERCETAEGRCQVAEGRCQVAEERCQTAEERCLSIEQSVREEVADEMELRLDSARQSMLERLEIEEEWREGYVDRKIEIMKRGIQVHEDIPLSALEQIEELEEENERLRREVMQLKREVGNRSPSKGQAVKGRQGVGPLQDVLNLDAFRGLTLDGER